MIMNDRKACDQLVAEFEAVIKEPKKRDRDLLYRCRSWDSLYRLGCYGRKFPTCGGSLSLC